MGSDMAGNHNTQIQADAVYIVVFVNHPAVTGIVFAADEVMVTNSLVGAVPVLSLDGKKLPTPSDLWQKISKEIL